MSLGALEAFMRNKQRWKQLKHYNVRLVEYLPKFGKILGGVFNERVLATQEDLAIYGLGRVVSEELLEILLLNESGLGYGAIRICRGMYERAITCDYISRRPIELQRFVEYFFVDSEKFNRRAQGEYGEAWRPNPEIMSARVAQRDRVKNNYKYKKCKECGFQQGGWSQSNLETLARELDKEHRNGGVLHGAYLLYAAVPNQHIHASMFGLTKRFRASSEGFKFYNDQALMTDLSLSSAFAIVTVVLRTQNEYFHLGLDSQICDYEKALGEIWPELKLPGADVADEDGETS